ncbi:MAG: carboxynorspermidine decarboxylase [Phycisphaerae bacterium]|nr:carboxynorspermidine decarboxylase [Phycisphaerae bacterium]
MPPHALPPNLDAHAIPSPCYVIDEAVIQRNCELIADAAKRCDAQVLLALKGFAAWRLFPLIRKYLAGVAASSLNEAKLGAEHFGKQVHVYSPAYRDDEIDELLALADHISLNSLSQWDRYRTHVTSAGIACALRINPQHSEVHTAIYDPCAPGSRLGMTADQLGDTPLDGITGLHVHTLCESNADALHRVVATFENKFARQLKQVSWVNLGGGHHITCDDYDVDLLVRIVSALRDKHNVAVYLEPGEAIALNAGVLVATVLDITHNELDIAILDTSAAAHMPDVLEMPYRPNVIGTGAPGEKPYTYRLAGLTCLAGDVIGDYSFDRPLHAGDKLVFTDMAHYTMVKNTAFNGVNLPAIAIHNSVAGDTRIVRTFGYEDYKTRLS